MIRCFAIVVIAMAALALPASLSAQAGDTYTARLGWVPTTPADRPNVTGKGSATATLAGRKLTIAGTFDGLAAPATVARLHLGIAKGARGSAISDLTITQAASGKLSGSVRSDCRAGRGAEAGQTLYPAAHSAKACRPDGSTLWGWFLK